MGSTVAAGPGLGVSWVAIGIVGADGVDGATVGISLSPEVQAVTAKKIEISIPVSSFIPYLHS